MGVVPEPSTFVAMLMLRWIQRHRVLTAARCPLPVPLVSHEAAAVGLETSLQGAMTFGLCGVHLITAPHGSERGFAAARVANRLLASGQIGGSVYADLGGTAGSVSRGFAHALGVDSGPLFSQREDSLLTPAFSARHLVFIGDNAEAVLPFEADIISLASKSVMTKQFCIVLLFSQADAAATVSSWNSGAKLRTWT